MRGRGLISKAVFGAGISRDASDRVARRNKDLRPRGVAERGPPTIGALRRARRIRARRPTSARLASRCWGFLGESTLEDFLRFSDVPLMFRQPWRAECLGLGFRALWLSSCSAFRVWGLAHVQA